ncbi:MAG: GNAT family N-acetyltransferase [Xanthobacteraceae bacterium]
MDQSTELSVRRLAPGEWQGAAPLIVKLRPHLDEAEVLRRVQRQSFSGYEMVGAFRGDSLVGVLGMRPVHTLVRGPHLHIDDLIAEETTRRRGVGRALMNFAEADARARGMAAVSLDARPSAIPFYERLGYELQPSPAMRKEF